MSTVTVQVDFSGVLADHEENEVAVQGVLNNFIKDTSLLNENYSLQILSVSVTDSDADFGNISSEITFDTEDFDEEIDTEKGDEESNSTYTERVESEAKSLIENSILDLCEESEMNYDIADVSL